MGAKKITSQINAWCKSAKKNGAEWVDNKHTEVINQVRFQNLPTYMEICNVDTPDQIDYTNPHVQILEILSDPINLKKLWSEKTRQDVYDLMDSET